MDTADLAVSYGFTPGVSIQRAQRLRAIGDALRTKFVDSTSPIAYGYGDSLSVYCFQGLIFNVSNVAGGGGGGGPPRPRVTDPHNGRRAPHDPALLQRPAPPHAPHHTHS